MASAIPAVRKQSTGAQPFHTSSLRGWNYTPGEMETEWLQQHQLKRHHCRDPSLMGRCCEVPLNYAKLCEILICFGYISLRLHRSSQTKRMEKSWQKIALPRSSEKPIDLPIPSQFSNGHGPVSVYLKQVMPSAITQRSSSIHLHTQIGLKSMWLTFFWP